jgi:hypothetical protein
MTAANSTPPRLSDRAKAEAKRILDAAARRRLAERLEQAKAAARGNPQAPADTAKTYKRSLSRT